MLVAVQFNSNSPEPWLKRSAPTSLFLLPRPLSMPAPTTLVGRLREVLVRVGPLGFVAFGGPGVHIVLFRRLFVLSSDPWLDGTTFADLFSLSGALPGPGSTQLLFSIALVRGGALAGILAFFLFS